MELVILQKSYSIYLHSISWQNYTVATSLLIGVAIFGTGVVVTILVLFTFIRKTKKTSNKKEEVFMKGLPRIVLIPSVNTVCMYAHGRSISEIK